MDTDSQDTRKRLRLPSSKANLLLLVVAAALLIVEIPLLVKHIRHSYFALDWGFGFYAALGLVGSVVVVFLSKGVASLLRRPLGEDEKELERNPPNDLDERLR